MDILDSLAQGFPIYILVLFSLCVHEYAHGMVAKFRGDLTAQVMGRLTLNPLAHADLMGTLILPITTAMAFGVPFGWAKPVPVNSRNLKNPKVDMFWIAAAGPGSNLILALLGVGALVSLQRWGSELEIALTLFKMLQIFIGANLFLAVFNLIPFHPLDGGKIVARFIPPQWDDKLEQNQMLISMLIMVFIFTIGGKILGVPVDYIYQGMISFWTFLI